MTRLFFMLRVIFLLLIFSIIEGFAKASQLTTLSKVDVKKNAADFSAAFLVFLVSCFLKCLSAMTLQVFWLMLRSFRYKR
jgi:hypothetical protein